MADVPVVGNTGIPLMPVSPYRARILVDKGRATVYCRNPYTIQMLDRKTGDTQPIELKMDTGYQHIGLSICTEKKELVSAQFDLLTDETERHNDCRKYRRSRRNRKTRYRKPRFNNRKGLIAKDGFAPSIRNKRDRHIDILERYARVMPITEAYIEMGQFDTQVLKAMAEGRPLPEGTDYQHGEQYGSQTLREAVFTRDGYKCIICGRSPFKDKARLREHHIGYWKGDRTNRPGNLGTVCEKCHTPKNHQPGGKLYGLESKLPPLKEATFMTTVRYDMFRRMKEACPSIGFHMTYGAATKLSRRELGIKKSHANDAYAMGRFHPEHRTDTVHYKKRRRNSRILSKFYDAKYTDIRDGSVKKGSQLSCGRTNRSIARNTELNERIYRGQKKSKGRLNIRTARYPIQPGNIVLYNGRRHMTKGCQHYGQYAVLDNGSSVKANKLTLIKKGGSWVVTKPA